MTFYERELRCIFENCEGISERKYNGRTMLAKIDQDLRVKASFITTGIASHYDAIRLRIINRTEGEVDAQTFFFRDIFNNTPTAKTAHIWDDHGSPKWYNYRPGPRNYQQLTERLEGYISLYQDEGMEMSSQSL